MRPPRNSSAPVLTPAPRFLSISIEPLEPRTLLAATVTAGPVVNVSHAPGQQSEGTIAIDPTNTSRLFAASNENGTSMFAAVSGDGGTTWSTREFATGADGLPQACCDPSAAFDRFGNLYFAYLNSTTKSIELLLSTDAGQNFRLLSEFPGEADQPTVATGADSVWVAFRHDEMGAIAFAAKVDGPGTVGGFGKPRVIDKASSPLVGDIAIGPAGQVLATYETPNTGDKPATVYTRLDPDGLGPKKFGPAIVVAATNVGDFDVIPAQARRSIDAEPGLAYDLSGSVAAGRVYLVYTDETPDESGNTDVMLRWSDDDGATWSAPTRVNDDATANSQFLPRVAVDPSTGAVGVTWHDARNDTGVPGSGSTNAVPNDDAQFYGAVGVPNASGVTFGSNIQITAGVSNTAVSANPNDYGDYTGLAFAGGTLHPVWADNSNSTGDNPDGALAALDLYSAALHVEAPAPPAGRTLAGQFGKVGGKLSLTDTDGTVLTLSIRGGAGYAFRQGDAISLRLTGAGRGVSVSTRVRGGDGRVSLAAVSVAGALKSFNARSADLSGPLTVSGKIGALRLGNVSGIVTSAAGFMSSLGFASLSAATLLSGAELGADGAMGGTGADADSFIPGSIRSLRVSGAVSASVIAAGLDPVNGILLDADDRVLGGADSIIRSVSVKAGADDTSRFIAGAFKTVRLPKKVNTATDPRFRLL